MYRILFILTFTALTGRLFAQYPGISYAKIIIDQSYSNDPNTSPAFCAVDSLNNIYISGSLRYGCVIGTDTLHAPDGRAFFVAKYDSSGNALWARSFEGRDGVPYYNGVGSYTDMHSMAVEATTGNIIITGQMYGQVLIGGKDTILWKNNITHELDSPFVIKLDSSGQIQWSQYVSQCQFMDRIAKATVDKSGNIYVTGDYDLPCTIGNYQLPYRQGLYVVKYDKNGNIKKTFTISNQSLGIHPHDIEVDAQNNIFISGTFADTLVFGSTPPLFSTWYTDGFVLKYDSAGNQLWAKQLKFDSNQGRIYRLTLSTDSAGNCYMKGTFEGTIYYENDTPVSYTHLTLPTICSV